MSRRYRRTTTPRGRPKDTPFPVAPQLIAIVQKGALAVGVTPEDDPAFFRIVASILDSVVAESTPEVVTVIQIKNWFDQKWLNFSGKIVGAAGLWGSDITLPPFNPNRVMSQTVCRLVNGEYESIKAPPLHILQRSSENLNRKLRFHASSGMFAWWTSNTVSNGRGSLMVYTQTGDQSSTWFLGFRKKAREWKVNTKKGIPDHLIEKYMGVLQTPEADAS